MSREIVLGKPSSVRVVPLAPLPEIEIGRAAKPIVVLSTPADIEADALLMARAWSAEMNGRTAHDFQRRWHVWLPMLARSAAKIRLAGGTPDGFVRWAVRRGRAEKLYPNQVLAPGAVEKLLPPYMRAALDEVSLPQYVASPERRAEYQRRFYGGDK